MDKYELYCLTDPCFYDSLEHSTAEDADFSILRRPTPSGWSNAVTDTWCYYVPDNEPPLPAQGWKIHVSARVEDADQAIAAGIAYVTEDRKTYGLNLLDTINRNVSLASLADMARHGVVDEHHERDVAERYRTTMNIKAPTVLERAGRLSGGNQQKVVLSKWIHADPEVLILDEPTRGIDVGAKYEIYTIINRLADEGKAILVISSELPELLGICDRIYALSAGRITGEVTRTEATQERLMQFMTYVQESA